MAAPLPLDPHSALRQAAANSRGRGRGRDPFPWVQFVLFLIAAGAAGWGVYYYYWQYRLPQERILTDRDGKTMQVRIEEDDGGVLKITSLVDGASQFYPVSLLSAADQEFFRSVKVKPPLAYPLHANLKEPGGSLLPVSVSASNRYFIEYSTPMDPSPHSAAMTRLTAFDQAVLATMDKKLKMEFPIDYPLTDSNGKEFTAHILGRSENLVRYATADGKIHMRLTSSLSPVEQSIITTFEVNEVDTFPVEMVLVTKQGTRLPIVLRNTAQQDIIFSIPSENDDLYLHRFPVTDISPELQRPVQSILPDNDTPLDDTCALTDKAGHTLVVKVLARSSDMVKFVVQNDNKTYIYPISNLSDLDQAYINSLVNDLTDDWDLPQLTVTVQVARAQLIDLDKKITNLQNELTRPEISQGDTDSIKQQISGYQNVEEHYITEIQNDFEKRIDTLNTQNVDLEGKIRDSNYSKDEKIFMQNQVLKNNDMVTLLKSEETTVTQTGDSVKSLVN